MNLYKHGLIFITFLGSCLCIGVLAAALGTRYWIVSNAVIINRNISDGKIFFGLFTGEKNLNFGIGWRTYQIDVQEEMATMMIYSYWLGTVVCMVGGILFAAISAVLAVLNSATSPYWTLAGIPGLYLANTTSIAFQIGAVGLWGLAYYKKLWYNVMSTNDLVANWTTEGMSFLGMSYWLVFASIFVQAINIVFIYSATSELRQRKKITKPVIEEKTNGAIMLY